ncbi:hypothetical protein TON_1294 [Thermococcus onnurineus NA1]|uniref:Uncharacterized protein n=1 Tax=Thermococcus onnurineus (strain NA1) TaxID=523850 RepID=B6YXH0_THEON|nr:hypothetical protein TON_1294 [Thermococcus onnurineus NA1]
MGMNVGALDEEDSVGVLQNLLRRGIRSENRRNAPCLNHFLQVHFIEKNAISGMVYLTDYTYQRLHSDHLERS